MSQLDENQISQIEQTIQQYINEHFSKQNLTEENNSFMFLEKGSLNLLLAYLLFMTKNTANPIEKDSPEATQLLAKLEELIEDNKQDFEALIDLFRSIS